MTFVVRKMWCFIGNIDTRDLHLAAFLYARLDIQIMEGQTAVLVICLLEILISFCLILKSVLSVRWAVFHYLLYCWVPLWAGESAQVVCTACKKRMQSGIIPVTEVALSQDTLMVVYYFIKRNTLFFLHLLWESLNTLGAKNWFPSH